MASATATARADRPGGREPEEGRRPLFRFGGSRLGGFILALNLLSLLILLTLPIFFPIVTALQLGMEPDDIAIWFGILVLMVVGIGLTAPPIGLNVFVVSAVAKDVPITATYRGVLPFVAADVARLGLVVAFPPLALWLVNYLS